MITQTAVEFLESEIKKFNTVVTREYMLMLLEQAKEMEKEQVINAYKNGQKITEQYYKEKYNI